MNLLEKLKNIIKIRKNIQEGDIIWVKRYKTKKEQTKIPEEHQTGPFVILKKGIFRIYALYGTTSYKDFSKQSIYFEISKDKYDIDKNTYVIARYIKIFKTKQFIRYIDKLDYFDFNYLKKLVYLNQRKNKNNKLKIKYEITKGDIVYYQDKYYYIYNKDDNYYYLMKVSKTSKDKDRVIKVGTTKYVFNYNDTIKVSKIEKLNLINSLNSKKQILFDIFKREYEEEKKLVGSIRRGDIIRYSNKHYYVYGEYKNNYLVYRIYFKSVPNSLKIRIDDKKYYTKFESSEIGKNKNIVSIKRASLKEIDMIKSIREEHKNIPNKKVIKLISKEITRGSIISDIMGSIRLIVIKRDNNTLYCVDYYSKDKVIEITLVKNNPYILEGRLNKYELFNLDVKFKEYIEV